MMRVKLIPGIIVLLCTVLLPGRGIAVSSIVLPGMTDGETVRSFSGETLSGEPLTLGSLLDGKDFLVVMFWGINCKPCLAEIALLSDLWENHEVRKRARVICVNTDGLDAKTLLDEMARKNIEVALPVVPDENQAITDSFVDGLIPLTVLIDRDRRIRLSILGAGSENVDLLRDMIIREEEEAGIR